MANLDDRLYLSHISALSSICQAPRMARSRSTPALEENPVATHITHTRYIRAGSVEPVKSIYSVFSKLEGHGRSSSVSRTDSWSRGSSMSRGSSTESLMTLAEARKKREGSQESISSTRSLKVISGKSIKTGLTRRGAKLNKDIHAPWTEGETQTRVISTPSLPTIGGGGSRSTRGPMRGTSSTIHRDRRASIEIPKHLEEIEKRLGIKPRYVSSPDVRLETEHHVQSESPEDLGYNGHDLTIQGSNADGEIPLDVEIEHVTAEKSNVVYARGGVRRRHTDLPERVARSRAKAQEEEAKKERQEKEGTETEESEPPPAPVLEQQEKVNKTNGIFTGGESDTKEHTGQLEEGESSAQKAQTDLSPPLPTDTDINIEETQLDIDNPTPSKKRKVDRTEAEEEEVFVAVLEEGEENKDEGTGAPVSFNMASNPGPTPTSTVEGGGLVGSEAGAAGGDAGAGKLLETEINYPSPEPLSIYPGGQTQDDDEEEEFEIEVEVVPESYMETPEYEEEESEYDRTHEWEAETPSFDDSDYYSYISESFERRDRVLRAMREQEMELASQEEPFSLQSSLDETEFSAYDDYVIPYITKNEPPARRSMDLSDYSDEFGQVPPWDSDTQSPSGGALSDNIRRPPAGQGELERPINQATGRPEEDTAASIGKPLGEPPGKPLQLKEHFEGEVLPSSSLSSTQGPDTKADPNIETQRRSDVGSREDQRVPEGIEVGNEKQARAAGNQSGAEEGDRNANVPGVEKGVPTEPLITPTEIPKVAGEPADIPGVKKPLKGILKRSSSTESYQSKDGDGPRDIEQQIKRYSYTEDLTVVPEAALNAEKPPEIKSDEKNAPEPSETPQAKEISQKPYYETDIDSAEGKSKKQEKVSPEKEDQVPKTEKMAEVKTCAPRKRREKTSFPVFSEFSSVDIRDSSTLDYKMRITILDIIMNFLLITPLVVLHYYALSKVLELVFLQYFPKIGTFLLFSMGVAIEYCCIFFQKSIVTSVPRPSHSPEAENIHFILASKAFYFVLAFGNICHMLAASEFVDLYAGESFGASLKTAVTSIFILWVLRCGRNVIAPPLYVSIDHDDVGVFSTSTLFKTEVKGLHFIISYKSVHSTCNQYLAWLSDHNT